MTTMGEATMNTEVMHWATEGSEAGQLRFPEVVGALVAAGVESYCADLVRGEKTYNMPSGENYVVKSKLPVTAIADEYSEEGVVAAIRGAQADAIRYPEFLLKSRAAGVVAYWVFLIGRRAVYLGRKGEVHIEEFPGARS
ncbi:DUF1398 family protein [Acidicapsa acidisoli]|uniref:DUF1398 family protein n=1 Tax=Acidicapsa acidisoli TaxID=1615681 RepID=UPI0021DFA644|nr:DUF1398 family protein [Acidicapsa acidisoli]